MRISINPVAAAQDTCIAARTVRCTRIPVPPTRNSAESPASQAITVCSTTAFRVLRPERIVPARMRPSPRAAQIIGMRHVPQNTVCHKAERAYSPAPPKVFPSALRARAAAHTERAASQSMRLSGSTSAITERSPSAATSGTVPHGQFSFKKNPPALLTFHHILPPTANTNSVSDHIFYERD